MIRIGTAGWAIPKELAASFVAAPPESGSRLARYARVMPCVEIDTSFYRPHRAAIYTRWADETPDGFRFAVKLPRTVTHEARLVATDERLAAFCAQAAALGPKLGVLLVQLPPSLAFAPAVVDDFLETLRGVHDGPIVCEPRQASWFDDTADALLARWRVGRVAADPALSPRAARPGGWLGARGDGGDAVVYFRWHGTPRMYWSRYAEERLAELAATIGRSPPDADVWVVFDNTAAGHALDDALRLARLVDQPPRTRDATVRAIADAAPR